MSCTLLDAYASDPPPQLPDPSFERARLRRAASLLSVGVMDIQKQPIGTLLLWVALATAMLLLIPFVAMRFTHEVSWSPGDFVAAAALLFGAGSSIVLVLKFVPSRFYRRLLTLAIALVLATVWAELAVGIFH